MIPEAQVCSDTYQPLALAPLATELFEEKRSSGPALSTERFGASQLLVLAQLCSGLAGTLSASKLIFIHPSHSSVSLRFRATPTPTSTLDRMTITVLVKLYNLRLLRQAQSSLDLHLHQGMKVASVQDANANPGIIVNHPASFSILIFEFSLK